MNELLRERQLRTLAQLYQCQRCEGSGLQPDLRAPEGEAGDCGNCDGSGLDAMMFPSA